MSAASSTSRDLSERYVEFTEDAATQFCALPERKRAVFISTPHLGEWPQAAPATEPHVIIHGLTSFQELPAWSPEDIDTFMVGLVRHVTSSDVLCGWASRPVESWPPTRILLFSPLHRWQGAMQVGAAEPEGAEATGESDEPRAVRAVRELCNLLELTEAELADLVGFSVRSIANWRQGRQPYPATVRNLYQVHAIVESLVNTLGVGTARLWLSTQVDGTSRLELLQDEDGLSKVLEEAAHLLYERPERERRVGAESEERAIEDEFDIAPRPELMKSSLRSRKR
jgi:transcriptional regulator with XRE-family HTH domain